MLDPIVSELFRCFASSPWVSGVVRYNQRGVGHTPGRKQLRGGSDFADVPDVCTALADRLKPDAAGAKRIALVGYSWGGCVAAAGLRHPLVAAYASLSFPLGGLSWVLSTRGHLDQVFQGRHVPRLFVLGTQDQFTKSAAFLAALREAQGAVLRGDDSLQVDEAFFQGLDAQQARPGSEGVGLAARLGAKWSTLLKENVLAPAPESAAALPAHALSQRAPQALHLRLWPEADHFWATEAPPAIEFLVEWVRAQLGGLGAEGADRRELDVRVLKAEDVERKAAGDDGHVR